MNPAELIKERERAEQAEQRNAELEAALRGMVKNAERDGDTRLAVQRALAALARAESATPDHIRDAAQMVSPAKHPDTERLDWLWAEGFLPDWESRDAIDAASKQGGAA